MEIFLGSTTKWYHRVRETLAKYGFYHEQGSGYFSEAELSNAEVSKKSEKIIQEQQWFYLCCRRFAVTDIEAVNKGREMLDKTASKELRDLKKKSHEKEREALAKEFGFADLKRAAEAVTRGIEQNPERVTGRAKEKRWS